MAIVAIDIQITLDVVSACGPFGSNTFNGSHPVSNSSVTINEPTKADFIFNESTPFYINFNFNLSDLRHNPSTYINAIKGVKGQWIVIFVTKCSECVSQSFHECWFDGNRGNGFGKLKGEGGFELRFDAL